MSSEMTEREMAQALIEDFFEAQVLTALEHRSRGEKLAGYGNTPPKKLPSPARQLFCSGRDVSDD